MYNVNYREMTEDECQDYDDLIESEHDAVLCSTSSNMPLLIAILLKCPRLYGLDLWGQLCEDIFFVIGDRMKSLTSIRFSFTKRAKSEWLYHFIYPDSPICKTLKEIVIDRSYWIDDEAFWYFGQCPNIVSISAEKPWITAEGLEYVFKGCKKLRYISIFKGYFEENLLNAFKALAENNKVIEVIDLDCADAIDDDCLDVLMDPNVCPKLGKLTMSSRCSQAKVDQFEKKRPNVDCDIVCYDS